MTAKLESVINILPVFFVFVTALFDLTLAAGLGLGFLVTLGVYELARRTRTNATGAGVMTETER
ncbi:MAG: hypothetical protein JXB47_03490 [Anaerolineae bacterium]|nr:hypothetical protein [Anaerolineae bacterium]